MAAIYETGKDGAERKEVEKANTDLLLRSQPR
jgi:hypothetical protein